MADAATAAAFRAENLISEYILSVMPILPGDGIPLFENPAPKTHLHLSASETFHSGVVQLTYRAGQG